MQKPRLSPGPSIVLGRHLGVKCRGKSSVRLGPGFVLASQAAGSGYWIKSSVRPRPGIVPGRRLAL